VDDVWRHWVNDLWQTDFSQFKILGWGYYYLSTVFDDFSRYILASKLTPNMKYSDVEQTLSMALDDPMRVDRAAP
jgi:transposase InsO family protein